MVLKRAFYLWPWGNTLLCTFINWGLSETEHLVNMLVLVQLWSWKGCFQWYWGSLCILFRIPDRPLLVSMTVLVGRWSWKGCLLVTQEKTWLCNSLFRSHRRQLWDDLIVLVGRWSWKGLLSVTLGKHSALYIHYWGLSETEHLVNMIVLVQLCSWKGCFQWYWGSLCILFRIPDRPPLS